MRSWASSSRRSRRGAWGRSTTSPTRCASSSPTGPRTSTAPPSWSTEASRSSSDFERHLMEGAFPIVRQPVPDRRTPVLVSVPHYGTQPLPDITRDDYCEPRFETFCYGFADTFVGDLYGDLHEHGATVLATPFSRIFVDVNRRRDDFEDHDGAVRSRRGVVRTHTMREVSIFTRALAPADLEARLAAHYDPYYATLDELLAKIPDAHGHAILLDRHPGS